MPAHIKDPRGSQKVEKRTAHQPASICATCQQPLRNIDLKDGCRRCLACRKASPHRTRVPRSEQAPAPTESGWLGKSREELSAWAAAHKYSGKRSDAMPMSPGGWRDV